jgi:hypothetical protein
MIAWMYNAYSVSCNLSRKRGILSFIGAFIASDIIVVIIFLSLTGYSPFAIDTQPNQAIEIIMPQDQTIHQTAEIVIEAFKKSEFKTVRAYSDDTMKSKLSKPKMRVTWKMITLQTTLTPPLSAEATIFA